MPRRRYDDDDEGFPDIRQKPGTPSDSFGGAYGPPDSDSESGYSRPGTAGSGESGSASLTFEDWQKKAGLGSIGGEDEFSKTDGSARGVSARAGRGAPARTARGRRPRRSQRAAAGPGRLRRR